MAARPPRLGVAKLPSHRPLTRPEDRDRPFQNPRRDPRLGPTPRCLSRGVSRGRGGTVPPSRAAADAVAAREAALRRLVRVSEVHAEAQWSYAEVRRELIDALLHLRIISLEAVETIERWRSSNSRGSTVWPDPTTGENYLLKMKLDTLWLADSPLGEVLEFSSKSDPFLIVPSARERPQSSSSNMMTPTLRARAQDRGGEQRKAVLPLQASLLRRIREAELVILKEAVQARIQQQAAGQDQPCAQDMVAATPACGISQGELDALAPRQVPSVATDDLISASAAATVLAEAVSASALIAAGALHIVTKRPRPPQPTTKAGFFDLHPVSVDPRSMQHEFETYSKRLSPSLAGTMGSWRRLGDMLDDEGASPLEWFWLHRADKGSPHGSAPDGLMVCRMVKKSLIIGELLHLSVVDLDKLGDAIDTALARMFTWMPIKSIRCTLWHEEVDGKLQADKAIETVFKGKYFKWFQLSNVGGARGQVMNRPRAPEPDGPDPQAPAEIPGISICLGQFWLQGGEDASSKTKRIIECPLGLAMAAPCLRELWSHGVAFAAAKESAAVVAAAGLEARQAAHEAIVHALLSGEFDNCLAKCRPVPLKQADQDACEQGSVLAVRLGKQLENGVGGIPCSRCDGAKDVEALVQRGINELSSDALEGLGIDVLSQEARSLHPKDAAFCRVFFATEWGSCMPLADGDSFEVPILSVGSCPSHPEPVLYLPTAEDDIYMVVIPCGNSVPPEDRAFLECTAILRATKPVEPAPYNTVRLESLSARLPSRLSQIADTAAFDAPGEALHVAEFGSWAMSAGRDTPGRLTKRTEASTGTFTAKKPYMLAVWHEELENLNVPLACVLVT